MQLSDASEMSVGVWTYSRNGSKGVTYVVFDPGFFRDGPVDRRWKEREAVMDRYQAMIGKIELLLLGT